MNSAGSVGGEAYTFTNVYGVVASTGGVISPNVKIVDKTANSIPISAGVRTFISAKFEFM